MKRFKASKNKKWFFTVYLVIIILTFCMVKSISFNFSENLVSFLKPMIKRNMTEALSNNFRLSILKKYNIDDFINVKYGSNSELLDVEFKINDAYNLASEICEEFKISGFDYDSDLINILDKDEQNIIIQVPAFYYLQNPLTSNIGPRLHVKLNYVRDFLYEVKVVVKNYGINSLLVEVYLNIKIDNALFFYSDKEFSIDYSILLSSKIMNGQVPSFYGGSFEKNTGFLNI